MESDVTDQFLRKIAKALTGAGFANAKYDAPYLEVSGAKFDAEMTRKGRVIFLGSRFKVVETDDGDIVFDVSKAIGLVVAALPEKLKAAADRENAVHNWTALRLAAGKDAKPERMYNTDWYIIDGRLVTALPGGFHVLMYAQDIDDVKEIRQ